MATNRNYGVTLGAYLDTSEYDKKMKELESRKHSVKFTADDKGVKDTTKGVKDLDKALKDQDNTMQNNLLTFQAANMILSKTIDIMSSMVEQVYKLNGAVTELTISSQLL